MKYVVVLCDGASGWKMEELGGKTCLEAAKTPALDAVAPFSETGLCKTVPDGLNPASDVANMSVLGFDPLKYYTGRSPLEAVAMGIELKPTDVTLRCNLVTLSEGGAYDEKLMTDYAAGDIPTEEADELIKFLQAHLFCGKFRLYPGISYRHCLIAENGVTGHSLTPPHDITGKPIKEYLPKGGNASLYLEMMKRGYDLLKEHPINVRRKAEGKKPANGIWLWGEGTYPALESFEAVRGKRGGLISAIDLVRGLGLLAGMEIIDVAGATGNCKTNFSGKAEAAADALLKNGLDFVYIHIDAPDECAHHADYASKIYAIEQIDEKVIKTLIGRFDAAGEDFAMLVCPDHPTPCALKTHANEPVPYLLYTGRKSLACGAKRFTEDEAAASGKYVAEGYKLIDKLLSIK